MTRLVLVTLFTVIGAAAAGAQARTADPYKRGLKDADFPRAIKLAEELRGELKH